MHAMQEKGACYSINACTLVFYILINMSSTISLDSAEPFRIKAYGLQELGQMYFPNSTPRSASAQLKKWINHNTRLLACLIEAGYYSGQRILTPKQVRIIVEHLDPP